jgi:hypothetical protein
MNKIKFGVSINKVGALTVWNYRIRTKKDSELESGLRSIAHLVERWYDVSISIIDSTQGCMRYDFSSTSKKDFDKVVIEIDKKRAEAEILAVKEKWQHLFDVRYGKVSRKSVPVSIAAIELEPKL